MGLNLGRWIKYAQAKLDSSVRAEHDEMDRLEAEREVELADRPWLGDDAAVPTFESARARIEWESEHQADVAQRADDPPRSSAAPHSSATPSDDPDPDPEVAAARVELDRRAREAEARLEAIRKELGVDPPSSPAS